MFLNDGYLLEDDLILEWKRRLVFWCGAISVGLVAILFAIACEWANGIFHKVIDVSPYLPVLLTPLGLVLIVAVTRKYFPGAQGSGIPQTIAALDPKENSQIREQVLSLRVTIGKIFLTIAFVGTDDVFQYPARELVTVKPIVEPLEIEAKPGRVPL